MNINSIHWGVQHTDRYVWGQIAGFDNYPDSNNTAVKLITKNRAAFEILTSDYTNNKD